MIGIVRSWQRKRKCAKFQESYVGMELASVQALKPVGVGAHIEAQECAQHGTQCGRVSSPWLHGRKWRERLDSRAVVSSHEDIRDIRALSNALTPVVQRNSEEGPKPDPATSIAYHLRRMRHPVKAHALSQ